MYGNVEPQILVPLTSVEAAQQVLKAGDAKRLLSLLTILHTGVYAMSTVIPGLVETSANLGVVNMTAEEVEVQFFPRSAVDQKLDGFRQYAETVAALTGFTASKILWVRNNQPEIYEKCAHILLPKDYVRYMLTGDFATEVSDASGMQLLDVPNRCWSDEVLEKLEIDKALLPKVYESPEITGVISEEAAKRTGLLAGTIVVGGAGDNAAAAVGTGVVEDGKAFTTIGTSGVVFAHTDNISIDPKGRVHTFCCAVPGAWHVMGVTQGAGLSLKWFRDNFCGAEKETAAGMGVDPYYLMDQQAARSPIGCNRLLYLPYLMGERTPHLDRTAAARSSAFPPCTRSTTCSAP